MERGRLKHQHVSPGCCFIPKSWEELVKPLSITHAYRHLHATKDHVGAAATVCTMLTQDCMHDDWIEEVQRMSLFLPQVLAKALEVWDLPLEPLDAPHMIQAAEHPEQEHAFICNLQVSGITVRAFKPLAQHPEQERASICIRQVSGTFVCILTCFQGVDVLHRLCVAWVIVCAALSWQSDHAVDSFALHVMQTQPAAKHKADHDAWCH